MSGKCKFRPLRANQKQCVADASVAWGFCKKHTRTVQAIEAQKVYDDEIKKREEEQLRELDAELEAELDSESEEEIVEKAPRREPPRREPTAVKKEVKKEAKRPEPKRRDTPERKKEKKVEKRPERKSQEDEISEDRLVLRPNAWGRFEDHQTGILFHPETKAAYGLQDVDGEVISLDDDAIKVCVENGWAYIQKIPRENRSRAAPKTSGSSKKASSKEQAKGEKEEEEEELEKEFEDIGEDEGEEEYEDDGVEDEDDY